MKNNFDKHINKTCETSLFKYILINTLLLKFIPLILLFSVLHALIYNTSSTTLNSLTHEVIVKLSIGIPLGILSGILSYKYCINLKNKYYTKKMARKNFILIYGLIWWGGLMAIFNLTYPLSITDFLINLIIYTLLGGTSFGYLFLSFTGSTLTPYCK